MKAIWAPWRFSFLTATTRKKNKSGGKSSVSPCVFCVAQKGKSSVNNLVLLKGKVSFVVMNKFPYSNGHVMVIPLRHVGDYSELTREEHSEMGALKALSMEILKKYGGCHGFNVGMNIGEVGGAGIPGHLHYHVVPRWNGDHNFMPIVGDTRVIPEHIDETYEKLRAMFQKIKKI